MHHAKLQRDAEAIARLPPISLPSSRQDLSGQLFGRLTVLYPVEVRENRTVLYATICACGAAVLAAGSNLKSGHTKSCGCLQRDVTGAANQTHGMTRTRIYQRWCQMIQRCHKPYAPNYEHYGARGIRVCRRWRESFEAFLEDMGEPPPGMWLERVDNDGPYAPGNCVWAKPSEQAKNTRRAKNAVSITHNGQTKRLSEWERETGIGAEVLRHRMQRGWSSERMLTTPTRGTKWK